MNAIKTTKLPNATADCSPDTAKADTKLTFTAMKLKEKLAEAPSERCRRQLLSLVSEELRQAIPNGQVTETDRITFAHIFLCAKQRTTGDSIALKEIRASYNRTINLLLGNLFDFRLIKSENNFLPINTLLPRELNPQAFRIRHEPILFNKTKLQDHELFRGNSIKSLELNYRNKPNLQDWTFAMNNAKVLAQEISNDTLLPETIRASAVALATTIEDKVKIPSANLAILLGTLAQIEGIVKSACNTASRNLDSYTTKFTILTAEILSML